MNHSVLLNASQVLNSPVLEEKEFYSHLPLLLSSFQLLFLLPFGV